jgi:dTDP-4-amino-4,6-dideoxygalactose transaminase
LNVKLKYLDQFNKSRISAADYYDEAFAGCSSLITPVRSRFSTHIFHQYTLRVRDGKKGWPRKYLADKKIPSMVYYPGPLHSQNATGILVTRKTTSR